MKLPNYLFCLFSLVFFLSAGLLLADPITSGTVIYHAIARYDFQTLFAPFAKDYPDWVNSIPTENEGQVTLAFMEKAALYDTHADEQVLPKQLRDAQAKAAFMQGPTTELKKLYLDLDKSELVRQVEFMGRLFLVSDSLAPKPWKLTGKMTKILDYTCMGAELKQDGKEILAYFTSEIPFLFGPDEFYGLPGLVLAVEVDGATAFLAKNIVLTPPAKDAFAEPEDGKKILQDKFDEIVDEKIREYNETKYEGKDRK